MDLTDEKLVELKAAQDKTASMRQAASKKKAVIKKKASKKASAKVEESSTSCGKGDNGAQIDVTVTLDGKTCSCKVVIPNAVSTLPPSNVFPEAIMSKLYGPLRQFGIMEVS